MLHTIVLALTLLVSSHVLARNTPSELGKELVSGFNALATKDYAAARNRFEKAAPKNIPAAQQASGDCFAHGMDRARENELALRWYRPAADSGIAFSLCQAGQAYIAGDLVAKDVAKGLALCTSAAQAESTATMMKLAGCYGEGAAIIQNLRTARFWYAQAAQRRNQEAQYWRGIMLSEGQGGNADIPQARSWLELDAAEGYSRAYLPAAILYANAQINPNTGALTPDGLARVYMGNSAAQATTKNPLQMAQIARIETMALNVMPSQWTPDLDRRVANHLAQHNRQQD